MIEIKIPTVGELKINVIEAILTHDVSRCGKMDPYV